MRRNLCAGILVGVACFLPPGTVWGQQYLNLRPAFVPGDQAYFRHEMSYRSIMRTQEGLRGKVTAVESMVGYRLRALADQRLDHHPLEITFVALMHSFGRPVNLSYDSRVDKDAGAPHAQVAQALLNQPFRVVLREDGSVASLRGLEGFLKREFKDAHPVALAHYRALVAPETLEQLLLVNLLKEAPEEVLMGGTWPAQFKRSTAGGTAEMVRDLKFVLEEVKLVGTQPLAMVSMGGKISLGKAPTSRPAEGPWVYKLSGEEEGTLEFDIAKRALHKVYFKQMVKQYMRWRMAQEKMGVQRIVDQLTSVSLQRTTLEQLLKPPAPKPRFSRIPPAATQPATAPAPPPGASEPTTQPAGEGT